MGRGFLGVHDPLGNFLYRSSVGVVMDECEKDCECFHCKKEARILAREDLAELRQADERHERRE